MPPKKRKKTGRPASYKKEYVDLAYKFALLGADDKCLASYFGVTVTTLKNWKNSYPEFLAALKNGKDKADSEISKSLYHRAKGYSHAEDKIFIHNGIPIVVPTIKHYPPDTTAAIFWLKNRQRALWRDRHDHDHTSSDKTMTPKIVFDFGNKD